MTTESSRNTCGTPPGPQPRPMMRYRIADLSLDGQLALLVDANERAHVARMPDARLGHGERLSGRRAKAGAHVLVVQDEGVVLHVRFESVDCSQAVALALIHPIERQADRTDPATATAPAIMV